MYKGKRVLLRALSLLACLCVLLSSAVAEPLAQPAGDTDTAVQTLALNEEPATPSTDDPATPPDDDTTTTPPIVDPATPSTNESTNPPSTDDPPADDTTTPPPTETTSPSGGGTPIVPPSNTLPDSPTPTVDTPQNTWDSVGQGIGAPACDGQPGCTHIGRDELGQLCALCALGQWMLSPESSSGSGVALFAASRPTELTLIDGENFIYRSGSYVVTGSTANATLTVKNGIAVSVQLHGVFVPTLNIGSGATVTLDFQGRNRVIDLTAASGAALTIDGSGHLTVDTLIGDVTVERGSVKVLSSANSKNGRKPFSFENASGVNEARLNGRFRSYVLPDSEGTVTLWLYPLGGGDTYEASVKGDKLLITSPVDDPRGDEIDLSISGAFEADKAQAYRFTATNPSNQIRTIDAKVSGATFHLTGVGTSTTNAPTFTGNAATYSVSGPNYMHTLATPATLKGSGQLRIGTLSTSDLSASGVLTLGVEKGSVPSNWQPVAVTSGRMSMDVSARFGSAPTPVLYMTTNETTAYAPLDDPGAAQHYEGQIVDGALIITLKQDDATGKPKTLTDSGLVLSQNGSYLVQSNGAVSGDITIPDSATVTLYLAGARTSGTLNVGKNANVTLVISGANNVGELALGESASVSISGTGALDIGRASDGAGSVTVDKSTCVNVLSGTLPTQSKPSTIRVTDADRNTLSNTQVTLRLGNGETLTTTTGADGRITLWRSAALTNMSVVVLDRTDTYADVLRGGGAEVDGLPAIKNVKGHSYGAVTFTSDTGNTLGVIYRVGDTELPLKDAYDTSYKIADMRGSECQIPDLKEGQTVTYRAFACCAPGAKLTADTQDAFAFSAQGSFVYKAARKPLEIRAQSRAYNGQPFALSKSLYPATATVAYYENGQLLKGPPTDVGEYTARVTVPDNDSVYKPGVYSVRMTIRKITVTIYPLPARKQKGEPDPDFHYVYDDSVMLGSDKVTGVLARVKGEAYGNYAYLTYGLNAKDYYRLVIDPDSPSFFIDWNIHHYIPFDPLSRIDPVYDEVQFSNGSVLRVQMRTFEVLRVGDQYYGTPVTDLTDGRERPFTPSLRLRGGYDSALLILTAEAELNADGGYATDLGGNRMLRGRRLTLRYSLLNGLKRQRVNAIAFALDGVMVLVDTTELLSGAGVQALLAQNDIPRAGSHFTIDLDPVLSSDRLTQDEGSAADAAAMGRKLMRVRIEAVHGQKRVDVTGALQNTRILFDASGLLLAQQAQAQAQESTDVVETVNGKPVSAPKSAQQAQDAAAIAAVTGSTESDQGMQDAAETLLNVAITRTGAALSLFGASREALDTKAVVPYTASESRAAVYHALLRTRPYLTTALTHGGLYGLYQTAD